MFISMVKKYRPLVILGIAIFYNTETKNEGDCIKNVMKKTVIKKGVPATTPTKFYGELLAAVKIMVSLAPNVSVK